MSYRGHIHNGVVVFDEPVTLADGTSVRVEPAEVVNEPNPPTEPIDASGGLTQAKQEALPTVRSTHYEHIKSVIGIVNELPPDFAEQHDHYIHGTPRE